ncbi:MAG: hypothetical protein Q9188_007635, partial [Gyalolechia gomerana]
MVTEKSATSTGLTAPAEEYNIPLNTDHSGLVKYKSRSQDEYSIVKGKLKRLVAQAKWEVGKRFAEKNLTLEQGRLWNNLNQPPYSSFRNSSKIAKPEKGTLEWLVREECTHPNLEFGNESMPGQNLRMEDFISWRDSDKSEVLLINAPPGREVVIKRIKSIDRPTERKIEEIIKDSPQDLDRLYHLLVQNIVQRDKDNARLLACIVYARRPLDLRALQDAMAIDPKEKYTTYRQCELDKLSLTRDEVYNGFGTLLDVAEDK